MTQGQDAATHPVEPPLRPPAAALVVERTLGFIPSRALFVAVELGIADHLAGGPLTADELASRFDADAGALYRLLRTLASYGIFSQLEGRRFGLNDAADLLRADAEGSLRNLVLYYGSEPQQAWSELLYAVQTGRSAFEHVFGATVWEYLQGHQEAAAVFNGAMRGGAENRARILRRYPWRGNETVIDVGGGNGTLLIDLLGQHPGLHGVVVDLEHAAEEARGRIADAGLEARCRTEPADMFTAVPEGGDAYVLAIVLHDWADEQAQRILESCRAAMGPHAVLLLIESVLSPDAPDDFGKLIDLHMLVETGGRERTEDDWRTLLSVAGLRLSRIFPGVPWSLIEVVRVE